MTRVLDGKNHRLALRPEALAEAADWIESQGECWQRQFDVVAEYPESDHAIPCAGSARFFWIADPWLLRLAHGPPREILVKSVVDE